MTQTTVKLQIPFASLVEAIASLELEEKLQLWQLLEAKIADAEDALENDPVVRAEVEDARRAYQQGDYQTIDEYIAGGKKAFWSYTVIVPKPVQKQLDSLPTDIYDPPKSPLKRGTLNGSPFFSW